MHERSGKMFLSIKHSTEVLDKLRSRGFPASCLSTYDFSTLYTTSSHNLIKKKLIDLTESTFHREGTLYLACDDIIAFFTPDDQKRFKLRSCHKICDALKYLLDNSFIRADT